MKDLFKLIIESLPPEAFQFTIDIVSSIVFGWILGYIIIKARNIHFILKNERFSSIFDKIIFIILCVLLLSIILLFLFGLISTLLLNNNIDITSKRFIMPFINLIATFLKLINSDNGSKIMNNIINSGGGNLTIIHGSTNNGEISIDSKNKQ